MVQDEYKKFNEAKIFRVPGFKLELRNYTSFDLTPSQNMFSSTKHIFNPNANIKPGEWDLIAGRKSRSTFE